MLNEGVDSMDINKLILLTSITLFIYFFFIQIFTILFRMTGMTKSKSRFQVISLFTNSGYTTQEAELIVNHQARRKLANTTMLFGYMLNVTVISVLINVILTLGNSQSQDVWKFVAVLAGLFFLFFIISRFKFIDNFFQTIIQKIAIKFIYGKQTNIIEVLDNYSSNAICEILIRYLPAVCDKVPLKENGIKSEHGIQVLAIQRKSHVNSDVSGEDFIETGDRIIVYGKLKNIKDVFLFGEEDMEKGA